MPLDLKITMTLLVRNEEDLLAENIRFHHAMGVDNFIVMDNLSTDGTPGIVKTLSRQIDIEYLVQPEDNYDQGKWVTGMARHAATHHGADWVINSDADEFWVPQAESLKSCLAALPEEIGVLSVLRHNAVVTCEHGASADGRSHPAFSDAFECHSRNSLGGSLPGKVLHRASETVTVAQGNHGVEGVAGHLKKAGGDLCILHYPYRSLESYKEKIRLGGAAYARNQDLPIGAGATWRQHYEDMQTGAVERFWAGLCRTPEDVTIGLHTEQLFRDRRVVQFISGFSARERKREFAAARTEMMKSSTDLAKDFSHQLASRLTKVNEKDRIFRPMYYNLKFALNSAETHLDELQRATDHPTARDQCAGFSALRDAYSLFPRNHHVHDFLAATLRTAFGVAAARLTADSARKRVVLHTSCVPRLADTQETVASFAPLDDRYHHVILLGQAGFLDEDETPLELDYDGRILRVPVPDDYENLHRKLFYAYLLFDLLTEPELLVKIDDNILLDDPHLFESCLDQVTQAQAGYAGRRVGQALHEDQWHGWHTGKCADPVVDRRGYQYPLPRDYAAGGYGYVLGREGLAACAYMYLSMKAFFAMRAVGLEDVCVGHAAYARQIELLELSSRTELLALPGLTTREFRRRRAGRDMPS